MNWRDAVQALTLDAPAKVVNGKRSATITRENGEVSLATTFLDDWPISSWTFTAERLEDTKSRIVRFLGVE